MIVMQLVQSNSVIKYGEREAFEEGARDLWLTHLLEDLYKSSLQRELPLEKKSLYRFSFERSFVESLSEEKVSRAFEALPSLQKKGLFEGLVQLNRNFFGCSELAESEELSFARGHLRNTFHYLKMVYLCESEIELFLADFREKVSSLNYKRSERREICSRVRASDRLTYLKAKACRVILLKLYEKKMELLWEVAGQLHAFQENFDFQSPQLTSGSSNALLLIRVRSALLREEILRKMEEPFP